MEDDVGRDEWLVDALSRTPELGAWAARLIEESYGGTDGCLFARRVLEERLGAGPDGIGEWVFREASGMLLARGDAAGALALKLVADTGGVLAAAETEWRGRYLGRPVTEAERNSAVLLERGLVRPEGAGTITGADGAVYGLASLTSGDDADGPAVIVTSHVGTVEVVLGFGDEYARTQWLSDRTLEPPQPGRTLVAPIPLWSCADGPVCRAVREERVLAWLLRGGTLDSIGVGDLRARDFTTYARSETYLAWLDAGRAAAVPAVREHLARRMLRAPAWAASAVGWPYGEFALAYLDRLAATPVTAVQGEVALRTLVAEDIEAVRHARRTARGSGPGAPKAPRPCLPAGPDPGIPRPRLPDDPPPGLAPRR